MTHVTELPDLGKMTNLRRIHLETMKGLTDLTPLLTAPALEELILIEMGHLLPEQIAPLAAHGNLRRAYIAMGSLKKDRAAMAVLSLPEADTSKGHPAFHAP